MDDGDATCDLVVRGLLEEVRERLVAQAKARRQSLNSYIVGQLTLHADTLAADAQTEDTLTMAHWMAELGAFRSLTDITGDEVTTAALDAQPASEPST